MESVERQTGVKPKELEDLVELPASMRYIWRYFLDLNAKRQSGFGPAPISYNEILAYFTLFKIEYDDFELAMILELDRVALEHFAEKRKAEEKRKKK